MNQSKTYDYIIVGAGSAGCILANKLTASGEHQVLLVEAGGRDRDWMTKVPMGVAKVWNAPRFNWNYQSQPEPALGNRIIPHPRGKLLGGSSSINMMLYVRGHRGDFDRWASLGLSEWSYDKLLPYFLALENYEGSNDKWRGNKGPLKVLKTPSTDPIHDSWFQAAESAGFNVNDDYNAQVQEGFASAQFNIGDGRRQSSSVAFLQPVLKRTNLTLMTKTQVNRVLHENTIATGIEVTLRGNKKAVFNANKEVILCGGAFNSPQLLMLSGIGDAEKLSKHGIECVSDNNQVGMNLYDHPMFAIEFERKVPSQFQKNLRLDRLAINMIRAYLFRTGPATLPLAQGTAFLKTQTDASVPDVQAIFRIFSAKSNEWFPLYKKKGVDGFAFLSCLLHPTSTGHVDLASNNPADSPVILNNFLSTYYDKKVMRDSFKLIRKLASQPAFNHFNAGEMLPSRDAQTDDEIDAYIKDTTNTVFHPAGTCRMGTDSESVVDETLQVRGMKGLRVVDASVMPDLTSGNINAPVMVIAMKAADLILGEDCMEPLAW